MEQYTWRTDPKIYTMNCPECGAPLKPDDVWLKKGSNSWYTLSQCPHCAGSSNAAGKGVFQRYKLARRDGLHWTMPAVSRSRTMLLLPGGKSSAPPSWSV